MSNALALIRSLIIYSLCVPLAIWLGYLVANDMNMVTIMILVGVVLLPLVPSLLRWHHLLLFVSWNTSAVLFFLPGRPYVWLVMAGVSLMLSVLQHILNRDIKFLSVPSVTRPLLFLLLVVFVTGNLTGGFGLRLMGGESMGGKRYIVVLGAVLGYFAMACYRVPEGRANNYASLYLLGGVTAFIGSMAPYFVSKEFYPIFAFFPVENLAALYGEAPEDLSALRLSGLTFASMAVFYFLLARHGVRGLFGFGEGWKFLPFRLKGGFGVNYPLRFLIFLVCVWVSLMGGYRSVVVLLGLTFLLQFYFEGLYRTLLLPVFVMVGLLAVAIGLPMVNKLPMTVQRAISFLPVDVDPVARMGAESSSEWRFQMWRTLLPTVPQYLLVGKGYAINQNELALAVGSGAVSASSGAESAMLAGDYHSGPLSLIIPLGIWGVIGFLWFLGAALRLLLNNYRHSDPELLQVNTFLLSFFIARTIYFFFVFGSFYGELAIFTGLVGLSVSLNGGMRGPATAPVSKPEFHPFKLARAAR